MVTLTFQQISSTTHFYNLATPTHTHTHIALIHIRPQLLNCSLFPVLTVVFLFPQSSLCSLSFPTSDYVASPFPTFQSLFLFPSLLYVVSPNSPTWGCQLPPPPSPVASSPPPALPAYLPGMSCMPLVQQCSLY